MYRRLHSYDGHCHVGRLAALDGNFQWCGNSKVTHFYDTFSRILYMHFHLLNVYPWDVLSSVLFLYTIIKTKIEIPNILENWTENYHIILIISSRYLNRVGIMNPSRQICHFYLSVRYCYTTRFCNLSDLKICWFCWSRPRWGPLLIRDWEEFYGHLISMVGQQGEVEGLGWGWVCISPNQVEMGVVGVEEVEAA